MQEHRGRDEQAGQPGQKRLKRTVGESGGIIEKAIDVDRINEEDWEAIKDSLWEEKRPLLRICRRNTKRARMACEVQAQRGEYGLWEVSAGAGSEAVKRSLLKLGYKSSKFKVKHLWRNSDEVYAAITSWGGSISEKSIGQTIEDAMILELEKREQDSLERMMQHGQEIQLEPDHALEHISADGKYWEEASGKELKREWVIKARVEEMSEFRKHGVYRKVPREECIRETGRAPIKVRWRDINKGDENNPDKQEPVRSPGD